MRTPSAWAILALLVCSAGGLAIFLKSPSRGYSEPTRGKDVRWEFLSQKYDLDGDEVIDRDEYSRKPSTFAFLDTNNDNSLTAADFSAVVDGSIGTLGSDMAQADRKAQQLIDQEAPDFELSVMGSDNETVRLSDFVGESPVVIFFGSYT